MKLFEIRKPGEKRPLKVCVGFCVHRNVNARVFNLIRSLELCPDPKFTVKIKDGDALIDRSRSIVAARFMDSTDADVLLYLDDDIIFKPEDMRKICKLVGEEGLDIVGGAYMVKSHTDQNRHLNIKTLDRTPLVFGPKGQVYEVMYVSTGCMAIHRKVFTALNNTLPLCHPESLAFRPYFMPMVKEVDGKMLYLSEDWAMIQRARDLGFKCWLDTTTKLQHIGNYPYDWDDLFYKKEVHDDFVYDEMLSADPIKVSEAV